MQMRHKLSAKTTCGSVVNNDLPSGQNWLFSLNRLAHRIRTCMPCHNVTYAPGRTHSAEGRIAQPAHSPSSQVKMNREIDNRVCLPVGTSSCGEVHSECCPGIFLMVDQANLQKPHLHVCCAMQRSIDTYYAHLQCSCPAHGCSTSHLLGMLLLASR